MDQEPFETQIDLFRKKIEEILPQNAPDEVESEELLASVNAMLEELQVAAEELHLQNKELINAQALLQQESHRYQSLFQSAPDAYLVTDSLGLIKQANRAASDLLNIPADGLKGKPVATFLRGTELQEMLTQLRELVMERGRSVWETRIYPRGRGPVDVIISAALQPDENNPKGRILWLVRDVSWQHRMEGQMHEARQRFQIMFEAAPVGIVFLNRQGKILESNPSFRNILQITEAELDQGQYPEMMLLADPESESRKFNTLAEGKIDRYETELVLRRAENQIVWIRLILSLLRDGSGQPQYILGMCEDTTKLHDRENEIIQLERYLEESNERERANLARDLHDGPLQYQISIIFDLQQMMETVKDPEQIEILEKLLETARKVVGMLRTTSGLLRSPILSSFGLARAITSYVDQMQGSTRTSVLTDLHMPEQKLPERIQQSIYRIIQNGLNNALWHAKADIVIIRLYSDDQANLILEIEDDGQGFEVPERWIDLSRDGHFGLIGAAERAASMGGTLQIRSRPGQGTTLRVEVPIREEHQQKTHLTDLGLEIPRF